MSSNITGEGHQVPIVQRATIGSQGPTMSEKGTGEVDISEEFVLE